MKICGRDGGDVPQSTPTIDGGTPDCSAIKAIKSASPWPEPSWPLWMCDACHRHSGGDTRSVGSNQRRITKEVPRLSGRDLAT